MTVFVPTESHSAMYEHGGILDRTIYPLAVAGPGEPPESGLD